MTIARRTRATVMGADPESRLPTVVPQAARTGRWSAPRGDWRRQPLTTSRLDDLHVYWMQHRRGDAVVPHSFVRRAVDLGPMTRDRCKRRCGYRQVAPIRGDLNPGRC
jgi:hypothetical protein